MKKFRVTSNYGGLVVSRVVEATDADEAQQETGIADLLVEAGFEVESADGEYIVEEVKEG